MEEIPNEIGEKLVRNEKGQFVEGHPDLGAGRPKGSISIKEKIRQRLMDNPEALEEIITYFIKDSRELMWQMLEGKPQQDVKMDGEFKTYEIIRGDAEEDREEDREENDMESISGPVSGAVSDVAQESTQGLEDKPV